MARSPTLVMKCEPNGSTLILVVFSGDVSCGTGFTLAIMVNFQDELSDAHGYSNANAHTPGVDELTKELHIINELTLFLKMDASSKQEVYTIDKSLLSFGSRFTGTSVGCSLDLSKGVRHCETWPGCHGGQPKSPTSLRYHGGIIGRRAQAGIGRLNSS